jgi:PRTRC genetic system protein E
MNQFFSSLEKTGIRQLGLSITYTDGEVSVSVLPKSHADDKELKSLRPLSLRASVEEMDSKFFEAIQSPLERTKTMFDSVEAYEASLKVSEGRTAKAKKQKESVGKKATALQNLIKEKDFNPMKDHERAIKAAKEVLAIEPDHKEAKKVLEQMSQYESPNLFQDADR